jgi:hypothetical protein
MQITKKAYAYEFVGRMLKHTFYDEKGERNIDSSITKKYAK